MLRFAKSPQPRVLGPWQATPGAGWDSLPAADKDAVREVLLRNQAHLCAYCQRRIPSNDGRMKVEHWQAQTTGEGRLRWSNLLGVCLGDEQAETGAIKGTRHCDTSRGDAELFLHPVEGQGPSPREHLQYTPEGEARPAQEAVAPRVQRDIDALNLNAARLKRARREVLEALKMRLDREGWTTQALREKYRAAALVPGVKAVEHCEVARYYLRRWAKKRGVQLEP